MACLQRWWNTWHQGAIRPTCK